MYVHSLNKLFDPRFIDATIYVHAPDGLGFRSFQGKGSTREGRQGRGCSTETLEGLQGRINLLARQSICLGDPSDSPRWVIFGKVQNQFAAPREVAEANSLRCLASSDPQLSLALPMCCQYVCATSIILGGFSFLVFPAFPGQDRVRIFGPRVKILKTPVLGQRIYHFYIFSTFQFLGFFRETLNDFFRRDNLKTTNFYI